MRLDGLRTYVQLASGLTEVARDSALATTRTLLASGASRLGFVSAAELETATLQARSLEERVQKLEAQMREQDTAAAPARKRPAPATKRPSRAQKATGAPETRS